ncbi:SDR family NAD(P)-dependent oxidoreductase [Rhodococcus hoagii]|jgi:NAD(P)-dependent dehydrogenase (short-subunit alcohol dehydrogenase family)|uniref:Short chain dehydrogenase n=1 Tax=Rhodococcus hoagii (strain 103S) TaxID=685727 RepID=A0A3S5Y131_RHOH1|nr:SDR family oxidoreductase [Prescottella equi]GBF16489.1 putative short-chain type dehydrogenase/reductase [Rhodococcus sp. Br-6]MBM4556687.1 SDR family NAD(P)-dependent oxidoreductase [Prescottella equi]MDP8015213.1 SDR family oxidoreductase [Prescottella equi]NKR51849.1 SDR family NAD(P)-dependent oxidoreductase [Prescottella equi]NKR54233.1 SDR family NAD(P)-dependent oxidoreductase [Prescottella equi]
MNQLKDRVIVVTGAGRGIGREHALLAAAEGARVVVNDTGAGPDGKGADPSLAHQVTDEITTAGGAAVANTADVTTVEGAQSLLDTALGSFGEVHGLVNNAGVLRDRMFVNMSEDEWDDVITGQLRATFAPCRVFGAHWRDRSKAGDDVKASIVNVSSTSGLLGAVGQSNYGAAKAGIASLTVILAQELDRYGVRANAITPVARTRMTENVPGIKDMVAKPADPNEFDVYHPGNVSPVVAYLLTEQCPANGSVFYAKGGEIRQFLGWQYGKVLDKGARWTVDELVQEMSGLV